MQNTSGRKMVFKNENQYYSTCGNLIRAVHLSDKTIREYVMCTLELIIAYIDKKQNPDDIIQIYVNDLHNLVLHGDNYYFDEGRCGQKVGQLTLRKE